MSCVMLTLVELNILATLFGAGISSIVGFLAWRAARSSAEAAKSLSRIEEARYHHQHTPQFTLACTPQQGSSARLAVRLDGPDSCEEMTIDVTLRDVKTPKSRPEGVRQEAFDEALWGPYRFHPAVPSTLQFGRITKKFTLEVGHTRHLALERTLPPYWEESAAWERQYHGRPLMLRLHCTSEGFKPWIIYAVVQTDGTPLKCS